MLKYSSILLLVAVTISLSQVDADPCHVVPGIPLCLKKRAAEDENSEEQLIAETRKALAQLQAAILALDAETSGELSTLKAKFDKALETNYDTFDEYQNVLTQIFEEVTGRKPSIASE